LLEALRLARLSIEQGGGPFGAVVARSDLLLASGHNRVVLDTDPTAHAEIVALRAAAAKLGTHDLSGCTLYTSCEPCPMCLGAALWARVDAVVYAASRADAARGGFDDARFWTEVALPVEARALPMCQREAAAGRAVFESWLAHGERRMY
jgi:tRNA(Arg) A34 adenosine deaminase TadA